MLISRSECRSTNTQCLRTHGVWQLSARPTAHNKHLVAPSCCGETASEHLYKRDGHHRALPSLLDKVQLIFGPLHLDHSPSEARQTMDSKVQELVTPLAYRLTQLRENQSTLPLLVAFGVVLLSYVLYNVRRLPMAASSRVTGVLTRNRSPLPLISLISRGCRRFQARFPSLAIC